MKVSIIIPCYFADEHCQEYLDLCLKSVDLLNYSGEIETIVSSSGDIKPKVGEKYRHVHSNERLHFPKAVNQGVRASSNPKYLFILNDDTCLTRDVLRRLVDTCGDNEAILNPISNCDNYFRYQLQIGYPKDGQFREIQQRFFRLTDIPKEDKDLLIDAHSHYPFAILHQEWLPIYATLIPKKVWDRVGEIDENFRTGQDDLDFSLRCRQLGIPRVIAMHALAWHFGGVKSSKVIDIETRTKNVEYFISKWGFPPPS